MIELVVTDKFESLFVELPKTIQKKAAKQQEMFSQNPFHPSLNIEKLSPREKAVWSFRVDRKYRIAFRFLDGKTVLLLAIGPHDWIYRLRF